MSEKDLDYSELYDRVQKKINDSDTTVLTYLKQWLTDRNNKVNVLEEWPYLMTPDSCELTFSANSYEADLPDDFVAEIIFYDSVADIYFRSKDMKTLKWIRENDPDNSETCSTSGGTDYLYFPKGRQGKVLAIHPKLVSTETTDMVIKCDYTSTNVITNDTDKPKMPNEYRVSVLVNGVCADYYTWKEDQNRAAQFEGMYSAGVQSLRTKSGIYDDIGNEETIMSWKTNYNEDD